MKSISLICMSFFLLTLWSGCRKFVELDPPGDRLNYTTVYATNATATAVLNGLYTRIMETSNPISFTVTPYLAFAADEMKNYNTIATSVSSIMYTNSVNGGNDYFWTLLYGQIYHCNAAINGIESSETLNAKLKQQLVGEAKFMRALCYYYLVNLFGKAPLITSPDYRLYLHVKRAEVAEVYALMIKDLTDAQAQLSKQFLKADAMTPYPETALERIRPTYWAAKALLARIYLYNQQWAEAEAAATVVIENTQLFSPVAPASAFLKNTKESIFQMETVTAGFYALFDARNFVLTTSIGTTANPGAISPALESALLPSDLRRTHWTGTATISGVTYRYPAKYKANTIALATSKPEYLSILRVGEQFLIRAEARAQLNNLTGAQSDLNAIRLRAGLGNTPAETKPDLLDAIFSERRIELFCEQGHRWFDLKRSGRLDGVMTSIASSKGAVWESYKQLFPVPTAEIGIDPNLDQNFGYQ